jgi:sucrose phosphorylase
MLVLHALFTGRTDRLKHWTDIAPRKQFTTLDTHDGIGVVDVVGLLDDDEIDLVSDRVNAKVAEHRQHVRAPGMIRRGDENPRQYQLMSTYYSALDEDDDAYLLARIVQLYAPGIPQVYSVGALFGENDVEALKASGDPRGINRHDFTVDEVRERVTRPAVARFLDVLRFRNTFPAFDGDLSVAETDTDGELLLTWSAPGCSTTLHADLRRRRYRITTTEGGEERVRFAS